MVSIASNSTQTDTFEKEPANTETNNYKTIDNLYAHVEWLDKEKDWLISNLSDVRNIAEKNQNEIQELSKRFDNLKTSLRKNDDEDIEIRNEIIELRSKVEILKNEFKRNSNAELKEDLKELRENVNELKSIFKKHVQKNSHA